MHNTHGVPDYKPATDRNVPTDITIIYTFLHRFKLKFVRSISNGVDAYLSIALYVLK